MGNTKLNDVTDCFQIPRIDKLDAINGTKSFAAISPKRGFCKWSLRTRAKRRQRSPLVKACGNSVTALGLCNAPETFKWLMQSVLRGITASVTGVRSYGPAELKEQDGVLEHY